MMKICGANVSPFVRKVLVTAHHKGIDFEHEVVMPGSDDPAFRRMSPLGKIPAMQDGDLVVSDSTIICEYLEDRFPEVRMMPESPAQRARARWYEEYGDTKMAEACAVYFFERIAKPLFGDHSGPDEARLADAAENITPVQLAYVESEVPESGFLFGDDLYIADIALISSTVNAAYAGYEIDAERFPKTASFRARVLSHPAVVKTLAVEKAMIESLAG
jgi:glutathione S-transferase